MTFNLQEMKSTLTMDKKIVLGFKQQSGHSDTLHTLHNAESGWPIRTPVAPAFIWLQEELTYKNGVIVELEKYIDHYGKDIDKIIFCVWHNNLNKLYPKLNFVYYPRYLYYHSLDAQKLSVKDYFPFKTKKDFVFLCLNMNKRPHRDKTVSLLEKMPSRLISYKARNWNIFEHDDWTIQEYNSDPRYNKSEMDVKLETNNLINLHPVYNRCQFSVVTETRVDLPFDFITEKTTHCFLALHPALYVSNKGHVQMLRDYGFDVFDDIFDNSYDNVENNRIEYMIESNKTVLEKGIPNYSNLKERLLKNREHFLNPECLMFKII